MFNNKRIQKLEELTKLHSELHNTIFNDSFEQGKQIDNIYTILSKIVILLENIKPNKIKCTGSKKTPHSKA